MPEALSPAAFLGWAGLFLLVPLLIGLVEVVKRAVRGQRWPLVALLLGQLLELWLALLTGTSLAEASWWGLPAGLAAAGCYSLGQRWQARGQGAEAKAREAARVSGRPPDNPGTVPPARAPS